MHPRQPGPRPALALACAVALALSTQAARTARATPPPQEAEGTVEITSPRQGDTVRGVVQIFGTALHPDFNHYTLEFGFDPNIDDQWFPVQDPVAQQAQNEPLAQWDTTLIADGTYQLRLRVVRNDVQTEEFIVTGIVVSNAVPTPMPTVAPSLTPTAGIPTPGPSPTPLIQQPPTSTPRPTATPGGPTLTPTPRPDTPLSRRQLRGALCSGAGIAVFVFALLGFYAALRAYARAEIRRWWLRFRAEVLPPSRRGRR